MREFLIFSGVIYGSLLVGWFLRKRVPHLERHSRLISRFTMLVLEAPLIILVYWDLDRRFLADNYPVAFAAPVILGICGLTGYLIVRGSGLDRGAQGAFVVSSMFSNIGSTLGGFLCLLYLGDNGLVLSQLFVLPAFPFFFIVVLTVARQFSSGQRLGILGAIRENFRDPVSVVPLAAIVTGLALGISGVTMPPVLYLPRRILVYVTVISFGLSFGLTARFRVMAKRVRKYLAILPIKFIIGPAAGFAVAAVLGYSLSSNPLAFKVILIQSAMPVALWSVVAAKLFRLDEQMALGLWIFTTICVAPLVPAVAWLAGLA